MKRYLALALIAALMLAGVTSAQAPEFSLLDYECTGQRVTGLVVAVSPLPHGRVVKITIDHTICLPPGSGS